jgi:hypothetical protein
MSQQRDSGANRHTARSDSTESALDSWAQGLDGYAICGKVITELCILGVKARQDQLESDVRHIWT